MNEIMEKTRELGELIQNSEEMKNVKNAEILQENDDKAQELLKEFPGFDLVINPLSLSVACHIGPGSLAVACCKKIH